ncbi:hypothetical protein Tco_0037631 [Tanacetum coccineum]
MNVKDTIAMQRCGLSAKELNECLSSYPIPSKYDVILPTSTQTIFDAPPGTCSPSASVNTKLPKDVEEPEVQPAEITADSGESPKADVFVVHPRSVAARIKKRKCKTRGGSSRPLVKRKLASGSSSSRVVRDKTFASKDDASILSISDDDEGKFSVHLVLSKGIDLLIHPLSSLYVLLGLPDYFKLKDANACHLKISVISPPAWKGYLDNQMDLELLDLHDRCYARHAMVDNAVNRRAHKFLQVIEKISAAMAEFDQNPDVLALREKICSLTANKAKLEAVEASLRREVEELKKDRRDVVSKVVPYAAMKLVHSDKLGRLVGTLVSSAITYGCCRAYEQVAAMKVPFDLSKDKGYHSWYKKEHTQASNDFATATFLWLDEFVADVVAPIEALLLKKSPTLQKPAPLRT